MKLQDILKTVRGLGRLLIALIVGWTGLGVLFLFLIFSLLNANPNDVIIMVYIGLFLIVIAVIGGISEFVNLIP